MIEKGNYMTWYAAHLIEYFKIKEGYQDTFPVWENVILLRANSSAEALKLARQIGEENHKIPDDSWRVDDKPAIHVFLGIRKVVECDIDDSNDPNTFPNSGTEITYIKMQLATEDDVQKLVRGDSVTVIREDVGPNTD